MDDIGKRKGTSSIPLLHQALCIISNPSVKSNLIYGPKTLSSGQHWWFLSCVTLKWYGWPWKTIRHLFYTVLSFVYHFKAMGEFKLELQSGNSQFRSKFRLFCPMWPWNLTDDIEKHGRIEIGVTVRRRSIWVKSGPFCPVWNWTDDLENNRAPLLCWFKLCA